MSLSFVPVTCFNKSPGKFLASLALGLLLAACGGGSGGSSSDTPSAPAAPVAPVPPTILANTVVAYPGDTGELRLYAGQSQQLTVRFSTSDGGTASQLALGLPTGGLPSSWRISSDRSGCDKVDGAGLCQLALAYAPVAAEQSASIIFPYSYRNNRGDASTGSVTIAYAAMAVNAATAILLPGGPVRGMAGKTSNVVLSFGTNDGSPATVLHVENDPAQYPAGWTSTGGGLDCANFGAGASCQLPLTYTPASSAPASVLAIRYSYKDSSGKEQAATATIDYSAIAPNTVDTTFSPAGVVRAKAGSSQQVKLMFAPSDTNPASSLRLVTDLAKLPPEWTMTASTLPCASVSSNGGCSLTLVYTPGPDQPPGKLNLDYAYVDAVGRDLTGNAIVSYASHDYRAYVADFGGLENNELIGGVRQCELDSDGKLTGCLKAATAWPLYGANNVVVYGGHAYISSPPRLVDGSRATSVTVCNLADDNALVDCAGSGLAFDALTHMAVNNQGVLMISAKDGIPQLTNCGLQKDGRLASSSCGYFPNTLFKALPDAVPTALTGNDYRFYIAATNRSTGQSLYSCAMSSNFFISCNFFAMGAPDQVVQRMSTGQAGGRAYVYLATASLSDPEKVAGSVVKCALDGNGDVAACDKGLVPPGLNEADLIRISDIRIASNRAYLVTGDTEFSRKIYKCDINQLTGDLAACVDAGAVEGKRNVGIMVR